MQEACSNMTSIGIWILIGIGSLPKVGNWWQKRNFTSMGVHLQEKIRWPFKFHCKLSTTVFSVVSMLSNQTVFCVHVLCNSFYFQNMFVERKKRLYKVSIWYYHYNGWGKLEYDFSPLVWVRQSTSSPTEILPHLLHPEHEKSWEQW